MLQPDIGNPEVRKLFVQHALELFRKNPKADMVSVEPNDGGAFSQSDEFGKLGSISDAVFGLANEVARAVQKEYPGKMVGVLAYREHGEPPSFPLEPNVHVQFAGLFLGTKYTRAELLEQWARKHKNLGFYDYYAPFEWYYDQLPGANASSLTYLTTRIREEAAAGAASIDGQSSNSWILLGMGHWIANRKGPPRFPLARNKCLRHSTMSSVLIRQPRYPTTRGVRCTFSTIAERFGNWSDTLLQN